MKINTISLIAVAALVAGAAVAQPQASPPAAGASASESYVIVPTLNQRMQRMQEQMRQIHATTDPATRKRLMDEHMKSMEQTMPMMSGTVMGMGAGRGAGMGSSRGMGAGPDTGQRMMMMEMRMDLMQKMMEQMLQHEAAAQGK